MGSSGGCLQRPSHSRPSLMTRVPRPSPRPGRCRRCAEPSHTEEKRRCSAAEDPEAAPQYFTPQEHMRTHSNITQQTRAYSEGLSQHSAPPFPTRPRPDQAAACTEKARAKQATPPAGEADPDVRPHPQLPAMHGHKQSSTTQGAGHSIAELLHMYCQLPGCTKHQAGQPVIPHA